MPRYIDAEKLKEHKKHSNEFAENVVSVAYIDWAPTEDVTPVIHAHWEKPNNRKKTYMRRCSNCHGIAYYCGKGNYQYCPNCNAKMDGGVIDD